MRSDPRLEDLRSASFMLKEARKKTSGAREELLTYLIDMAFVEAEERIRIILMESKGPASW